MIDWTLEIVKWIFHSEAEIWVSGLADYTFRINYYQKLSHIIHFINLFHLWRPLLIAVAYIKYCIISWPLLLLQMQCERMRLRRRPPMLKLTSQSRNGYAVQAIDRVVERSELERHFLWSFDNLVCQVTIVVAVVAGLTARIVRAHPLQLHNMSWSSVVSAWHCGCWWQHLIVSQTVELYCNFSLNLNY